MRSQLISFVALLSVAFLPVRASADEPTPGASAWPASSSFPHVAYCPEADAFVDEVNNKRAAVTTDRLALAVSERDLGREFAACSSRLVRTGSSSRPQFTESERAVLHAGIAYALAATQYGELSKSSGAGRERYEDDFVRYAHLAYVCFGSAQSQSKDDDTLRTAAKVKLVLLKQVDEYVPLRRAEVTSE